MNTTAPIEYGRYYHIYNRGINGCDLFREAENYEHFLLLYDKYILLITDTYAWCLMKNHFHFLVRIKEKKEIGYLPPKILNPDRSGRPCQVYGKKDLKDLSGSARPDRVFGRVLYTKKTPKPEKQFSHLFNAYAKAFNKSYNRTGSLFERPFQRIEITTEEYLRYLIYYIHHNPVHHGFTENMLKYTWSSFLTINSTKTTRLKRQEVIELFGDIENFIFFHNQQHDLDKLKNYLID